MLQAHGVTDLTGQWTVFPLRTRMKPVAAGCSLCWLHNSRTLRRHKAATKLEGRAEPVLSREVSRPFHQRGHDGAWPSKYLFGNL